MAVTAVLAGLGVHIGMLVSYTGMCYKLVCPTQTVPCSAELSLHAAAALAWVAACIPSGPPQQPPFALLPPRSLPVQILHHCGGLVLHEQLLHRVRGAAVRRPRQYPGIYAVQCVRLLVQLDNSDEGKAHAAGTRSVILLPALVLHRCSTYDAPGALSELPPTPFMLIILAAQVLYIFGCAIGVFFWIIALPCAIGSVATAKRRTVSGAGREGRVTGILCMSLTPPLPLSPTCVRLGLPSPFISPRHALLLPVCRRPRRRRPPQS